MDIEYKGANCVVFSTKKGVAVTDPKLSLVGLKDYNGKMDVVLATQKDFGVEKEGVLLFDGPGEYETEGFSIQSVAAQVHTDTPDSRKRGTIFKFEAADIRVAVLGHVAPELSEDQSEKIGTVDVVVVPVGGNGYTLDAHAAVQLVRQLDPKVVVPTHYSDKALKYEVPQAELEPFVKELGAPVETTPKLKLKTASLPEVLTVYELSRTS